MKPPDKDERKAPGLKITLEKRVGRVVPGLYSATLVNVAPVRKSFKFDFRLDHIEGTPVVPGFIWKTGAGEKMTRWLEILSGARVEEGQDVNMQDLLGALVLAKVENTRNDDAYSHQVTDIDNPRTSDWMGKLCNEDL